MRNPISVGPFSLLTVAVIACGAGCARAPAKPPELYEYSLGGQRAPNRSYWSAGVDPCRVARTLTADETRAMNALLARFLEQTSLAPDAQWPPEQLALLEEGARTLPPELEVYERTLSSLAGCRQEKGGPDVAALSAEGVQLIQQARERIPNASAVAAGVRKRKAISDWRAGELAAQETEKQSWCPPKPKPIPDIYFAWQDETGKLEWLFCDGSRVTAQTGEEPQYVAVEPQPKVKTKQTPAGFVKAAKGFPDSEIRRPPNFDLPPASERTGTETATQPTESEPAPSAEEGSGG